VFFARKEAAASAEHKERRAKVPNDKTTGPMYTFEAYTRGRSNKTKQIA
jgi:hypothetical protein